MKTALLLLAALTLALAIAAGVLLSSPELEHQAPRRGGMLDQELELRRPALEEPPLVIERDPETGEILELDPETGDPVGPYTPEDHDR